jgi:hypothetical protein
MVSREWFERIDAARPGEVISPEAPDVTAADVDRVRERIAAWDRKIGAAVRQGDVPAGLAERLVASLAMAREGDAIGTAIEQGPLQVESSETVLPVAPATSSSRRTIIRSGALLVVGTAVAASVLFLMGWFDPKRPAPSPTQLLEHAIAFYQYDARDEGRKTLDSAPRDLPPSDDVILPPTPTWRQVSWEEIADSTVVAYDLDDPSAAIRATLYATAAPVDGSLGTAPPAEPMQTQGRAAGAWQVNQVVYVLVVEGNAEDYRRALQRPGGLLARARVGAAVLAYAPG